MVHKSAQESGYYVSNILIPNACVFELIVETVALLMFILIKFKEYFSLIGKFHRWNSQIGQAL